MVRILRVVIACSCFAVCVGVLVLWLRSYASRDSLHGPPVSVFAWRGQIAVWVMPEMGVTRWHVYSRSIKRLRLSPQGELLAFGSPATWPPKPHPLGFSWERLPAEQRIVFPHWFPALLSAIVALLVKPPPRLRLGLRELFTLTTIAALTVGGIALLFRSAG